MQICNAWEPAGRPWLTVLSKPEGAPCPLPGGRFSPLCCGICPPTPFLRVEPEAEGHRLPVKASMNGRIPACSHRDRPAVDGLWVCYGGY